MYIYIQKTHLYFEVTSQCSREVATYIDVGVRVHLCVCVYTCVCVCSCVYIYAYLCIYI